MRRALLTVVLLLAGCPRKPSPPPVPRLVEIRVVDRTAAADRPAPVDVVALTARATDALRAGPLPLAVGATPLDGVDYRLKIDVRLEGAETADKGVLRAFVDARLSRIGGPIGEPPIVNQAMAERIYSRADVADRATAFRAHVEHAVDDVMKGLAAQARLHVGTPADLVAGIGDPDAEIAVEAIHVAGERKERAAVPKLIELLKCEDQRLRDRALGALIEIGDRRAVRPITEAARFRDVGELPKVIDAVASLGGDDARAYLEFVSTGHDDPDMRDLAKEALGRLDRRAAPAPHAP